MIIGMIKKIKDKFLKYFTFVNTQLPVTHHPAKNIQNNLKMPTAAVFIFENFQLPHPSSIQKTNLCKS